ncbi:MAG: hypothetical protein R3A80_00560 [Bdellovibrionota bacterium]
MKRMKIQSLLLTLFLSLNCLSQATASEFTVGGQVGALGLAEGPNDTGLGYGAFFQATALEILALQVDYLGSKVNSENVSGISPNLMWNAIKYDELRFGLIAGPGFYKLGDDPWRFGLSGGAFGEVSFIPNMPIGLQTRYHSVFGGKNNDLWSVFMTVGFRFDVKGGDDW